MEEKIIEELFRYSCSLANTSDNTSNLFSMEPTEACTKILSSYGCYYRETDKGFLVAAEVKEDNGRLKMSRPFVEGVKLSFAVFVSDTDFFAKAGLPEDSPGEHIYYFNNLDETSPRTSLLLHNGQIDETLKVKLGGKKVSFAYVEGEAVEVCDCSGTTLLDTEFDIEIDTIKNLLIVDLSRREDGYYTITYNSNSVAQYCTKASFIRRVPLAIVEFHISNTIPTAYQIVSNEDGSQYLEPKEFNSKYGISTKYWRYKIIPVHIPYWLCVKLQTDNQGYSFEPKVSWTCSSTPVVSTSTSEITFSGDDLEVALYHIDWHYNYKCNKHPQYFYCNQHYGVWIDGELKCRFYTEQNGKKVYSDPCPIAFTDKLIGRMPEPEEVATNYYTENDREIAEMTVWVYKEQGEYMVSLTAPD